MKKVLLSCLLVSIWSAQGMKKKIPGIINFINTEKGIGVYNPFLDCNILLNLSDSSEKTSERGAVDWVLTYFPGLSRKELFGWPVFYREDIRTSKTSLDNEGFVLSRETEQGYRIMFTFNQENLPIEAVVINVQTDEIEKNGQKVKYIHRLGD